jgi:LysR family glycine cleavage system transcriptional activator
MASKPLPSLNALRAFEATARLGSVTLAATELCVTPSAVTHQVRKLEEYLDVSLISFASGRFHLSAAGRALLPGLSDGFSRIGEAIDFLGVMEEHMTLTVASRPFFAARWLAPRLNRFWERHPDIGLRLQYMIGPVEFSGGDVDVAIEWGRSPRSGLQSEVLIPGFMTPACNPSLLTSRGSLSRPADLASHTLLRESEDDHWGDWMAIAGVPDLAPANSVFLDDGAIRLQAALDGKGIELTCPNLLSDMMSDGRLVRPFENIQLEGYYFVVHKATESVAPKIKAFLDWLFEERE